MSDEIESSNGENSVGLLSANGLPLFRRHVLRRPHARSIFAALENQGLSRKCCAKNGMFGLSSNATHLEETSPSHLPSNVHPYPKFSLAVGGDMPAAPDHSYLACSHQRWQTRQQVISRAPFPA